MRAVKSVFGLVGALLPVVYCGGLVYYFSGFRGERPGSLEPDLGPTVLGLAAIGLLFCVPLVWKLVRMASRPQGPKPGKVRPDAEPEVDAFDPDAVMARYLTKRAAAGVEPPVPIQAFDRDSAAPRPSFGRKIG